MTAETAYNVAICLSVKEMGKLYAMLGKKIKLFPSTNKHKKIALISKEKSMEFIFRTVFCKSRII
jgi:hypothetical protein